MTSRADHVAIDGVDTRIVEAGPPGGPTVVLLHGVGGHLEAFERTVPALAVAHRVVAYDLPGHGWSSAPDRSYEIGGYARHLLALLDHLDVERADLVGLSLGGWIAGRVAIDHPGRVRRLGLVAPGGVRSDPAVMAAISTLSTAATTTPSDAAVRSRLAWLMARPESVPEELVATRAAIYARPGASDAMRRVLCLQDPDIRARNMIPADQWATIAAPTLVVWGEHDATGPADVGAALASRIRGAVFVRVADAGHWPQYEQPAVVNAALLDLLSSSPSAPEESP